MKQKFDGVRSEINYPLLTINLHSFKGNDLVQLPMRLGSVSLSLSCSTKRIPRSPRFSFYEKTHIRARLSTAC